MAETLLGGQERLGRFARLPVVDSKLQFWTLNHGLCDAINNEPVCPVLGTKRTYRGHCGNDAIDPTVWTGRVLQARCDAWRRLVLRFCIRPLNGAVLLLAIMDIRAHPISFSERP